MAEFSKESLINVVSDTAKESTGGAIVDTANGKITLPAGSKVVYEYLYDAAVKVYKSEELKLNVKMINLTDETAVSRYRDDVSVQLDIQYFDELVNGDIVDYTLAENESVEMYPYYDNEGPGWSRTVYTPLENKPLAYLKVTFENIGVDAVELSEIGLFSSLSIQDIISSIDFDHTVDVPKVKNITLVPRTGSLIDDADPGIEYVIDVLVPSGVLHSNLVFNYRKIGTGPSNGSTANERLSVGSGGQSVSIRNLSNATYEVVATDRLNVSNFGKIIVKSTGKLPSDFEIVCESMVDGSVSNEIFINIISDKAFLYRTANTSIANLKVESYDGLGKAELDVMPRDYYVYYGFGAGDVVCAGDEYRFFRLRGLRNGLVKVTVADKSGYGIEKSKIIEIKNISVPSYSVVGINEVLKAGHEYDFRIKSSGLYGSERFEIGELEIKNSYDGVIDSGMRDKNTASADNYKVGYVNFTVSGIYGIPIVPRDGEKFIHYVTVESSESSKLNIWTDRKFNIIDVPSGLISLYADKVFSARNYDFVYSIISGSDVLRKHSSIGTGTEETGVRCKALRDGDAVVEVYVVNKDGKRISEKDYVSVKVVNQDFKSYELDARDYYSYSELTEGIMLEYKSEFNTENNDFPEIEVISLNNSGAFRRGAIMNYFPYIGARERLAYRVYGGDHPVESIDVEDLLIRLKEFDGQGDVIKWAKIIKIYKTLSKYAVSASLSQSVINIDSLNGEAYLNIEYGNDFDYKQYIWSVEQINVDGGLVSIQVVDVNRFRIKAIENGSVTIKFYHEAFDEVDVNRELEVTVNITNQVDALENFEILAEGGIAEINENSGELCLNLSYIGIDSEDGELFKWGLVSVDGEGEASISEFNKLAYIEAVYNGVVRVIVTRVKNNRVVGSIDINITGQVLRFDNARLKSAEDEYRIIYTNGEIDLTLEADNKWLVEGIEEKIEWSIYKPFENGGEAELQIMGLHCIVKGLGAGYVWVSVRDKANNSLIASREIEILGEPIPEPSAELWDGQYDNVWPTSATAWASGLYTRTTKYIPVTAGKTYRIRGVNRLRIVWFNMETGISFVNLDSSLPFVNRVAPANATHLRVYYTQLEVVDDGPSVIQIN